MVAKELSVNVKTKIPSNMIIPQVSYYVWKMHNLQITEAPQKAKKQLRVRTKVSVDARMLKTLANLLRSWNFIQDICSFVPFI